MNHPHRQPRKTNGCSWWRTYTWGTSQNKSPWTTQRKHRTASQNMGANMHTGNHLERRQHRAPTVSLKPHPPLMDIVRMAPLKSLHRHLQKHRTCQAWKQGHLQQWLLQVPIAMWCGKQTQPRTYEASTREDMLPGTLYEITCPARSMTRRRGLNAVRRCQQRLSCMLPNNDGMSRPPVPGSGIIDRNAGLPSPW